MDPREMFDCGPWTCRLQRGACAKRFRAARANVPEMQRCAGCGVGEAHAAGELPSPDARYGPLVPAASLIRGRRAYNKYLLNGVPVTLQELAKRAGCRRPETIRIRLRRMTPEAAVAMGPRGNPLRKPAPPAGPAARRAVELLTANGLVVRGVVERPGRFEIFVGPV